MSRYRPLVCLALLHTLVDTCATLIEPLWPQLERQFGLVSVVALSVAFVAQQLPPSLSQAVFGYVRDRRATPFLIWLGPVFAAVFLTAIGVAPHALVLGTALFLGGVGVGAFHPEGAVMAGHAFPEQRTRALALFLFGGSLGIGLGPTLSGAVASRWGVAGLLVLTVPLLAAIGVLWRVGRLGELSKRMPRRTGYTNLRSMLGGRFGLAVALLLVCSLRLVPNLAMLKVLSFEMSRRGHGEASIGLVQSLFLVSASVGMMLMALHFRSGWEKRFMVLCPLAGIPLLFLLGLPGSPEWLFIALLVPSGFVLWGTTPAMVSYGQELFPNAAGVASAITMGISWGVGGMLQAPITAYFQQVGTPYLAYQAFIVPVLLGAIGAWMLPSTSREISAEQIPAVEAQAS